MARKITGRRAKAHTDESKYGVSVAVRLKAQGLRRLDAIQEMNGLRSRPEALRHAIDLAFAARPRR